MIATLQPTPLDQWRHCLGDRRRRAQPRPIAATGYLIEGPAEDDLIEVERLTFILLYDEQIGSGPCALRLAGYAARIGRTPACLLEYLRRNHQGFILFPLAWVSHHWQQAASIFADLRQFPERQVFCIRHRNDLTGFHDAAEYDFCRHAGRCGLRRPRYQRQPVLASA